MTQAQRESDILFGESDSAKKERDSGIVRTSIIGIVVNLLLALFKIAAGLLSHSIAIVLDAVNNTSDAASSVITIIGTRLAAKPADKKHPFGYGRIEYLSAMVISIIILYAGITSLIESVKKIFSPSTPDYTATALIIVAVGVIAKIVLGRFVKAMGKAYNSESLVNSGEDATMDAVISASTLVAAIVYLKFNIALEACLGSVISIAIIKSGIEMLKETISEILGERASPSLARNIKNTVTSFPDVKGAYDLVLNNYGPDSFNGSVHIDIPDTYTADKIDELVRNIQLAVFKKHNVVLTAIGVYSYNTKNAETIKIRERIMQIVCKNPNVLQVHGFYRNEEAKTLRFDVVISFDAKDRYAEFMNIVSEVQKEFPAYKILAALDTDYSELEADEREDFRQQ